MNPETRHYIQRVYPKQHAPDSFRRTNTMAHRGAPVAFAFWSFIALLLVGMLAWYAW